MMAGKYPTPFDTILEDAGIAVVFSGVRMPRMNAVMERWVRTCRRELLDQTMILNQRHHEDHDWQNGTRLRPSDTAPPRHAVDGVVFGAEPDAAGQ